MKRLRRWAFDGLALFCLVLCFATIAMWLRSRSVDEGFYFFNATASWGFGVDSSMGSIGFGLETGNGGAFPMSGFQHIQYFARRNLIAGLRTDWPTHFDFMGIGV